MSHQRAQRQGRTGPMVDRERAGGLRSAKTGIPPAVILPLRLFLGATFLYAGLQKLLDPAFFSAGAPGYIGEQLRGYVRAGSPLSPLLNHLAIPHASLIGTLVALAELWIGLSTLTGLLSRLGAFGGMLLSLTFFLTASWTVHPYFLGPDLPYVAAWFTLFLTGPGPYSADAYLIGEGRRREVARSSSAAPKDSPIWIPTRAGGTSLSAAAGSAAMTRWSFLAKLSAAVVLTALSTGIAAAVGKRTTSVTSADGGADELAAIGATPAIRQTTDSQPPRTATGTPSRTVAQNPNAASTVTPTKSGRAKATTNAKPTATATIAPETADAVPTGYLKIGNVGAIGINSAARFTDPISGDPSILVHLPDDSWVAYDAVCPHAGCTVRYTQSRHLLHCPCHGALFDPTDNGTAVSGPTNQPLAELKFKIDANGDFYAKSL